MEPFSAPCIFKKLDAADHRMINASVLSANLSANFSYRGSTDFLRDASSHILLSSANEARTVRVSREDFVLFLYRALIFQSEYIQRQNVVWMPIRIKINSLLFNSYFFFLIRITIGANKHIHKQSFHVCTNTSKKWQSIKSRKAKLSRKCIIFRRISRKKKKIYIYTYND